MTADGDYISGWVTCGRCGHSSDTSPDPWEPHRWLRDHDCPARSPR